MGALLLGFVASTENDTQIFDDVKPWRSGSSWLHICATGFERPLQQSRKSPWGHRISPGGRTPATTAQAAIQIDVPIGLFHFRSENEYG